MMTHAQKVEQLREDLAQRGVSWFTAAPPLVRALWAAGFAVPPLLFWRPTALALLFGTLGLFTGAMLWAADVLPDAPATQGLIVGGLGVLYALWGAWFYRRKARQLDLPAWSHYPLPGDAPRPDAGANPRG